MIDNMPSLTGHINTQNSGRFEVKPNTMLCRSPRFIDSNLKEMAPRLLIPSLGNVKNFDLGEVVDKYHCEDDGENLVNYCILTRNKNNQPYKIVLVVWQGKAVWAGGIERNPHLLHPDSFAPADDLPGGNPYPSMERLVSDSIERDSHDLSDAFSDFILGEK